MRLYKWMVLSAVVLGVVSCATVNNETVKGMSVGSLCEFLGPAWILTAKERDDVYHELERRDIQCTSGHVASKSQDRRAAPPAQGESSKSKSGSGFYISTDGYILTNEHVIRGCQDITIQANHGRFAARFIASDAANDLALLQGTNVSTEYVANFRLGDIRIGEDVTAVGFPLGQLLGSTIKATSGTVSSLTGIMNDSRMMQISVPIQPGNSGGPLLDDSGFVVGVVASKLNDMATAKLTGSLPQNVNFAIKNISVNGFLSAHGVEYQTVNRSKPLSRPDIVEAANRYTVMINCK